MGGPDTSPRPGTPCSSRVARHTLRPCPEGRDRKRGAKGDRMSLTPQVPPEGQVRVEDYVKGDLSKDTNWWGAFVVGLAGTILVTGVTSPVLAGLGSAAIPNFFFWTVTGWLLCMFLAEMAAMLPERTGGAPAYAYFAFQDRLPRAYPH